MKRTQMKYVYPDKGDRITCCLIEEYDSQYWQDSEKEVLELAIQSIKEQTGTHRRPQIGAHDGSHDSASHGAHDSAFHGAHDGSQLRPDKKIKLLDLGCGMGRLFQVFAGCVDEIKGAEPDRERFAAALSEGRRVSEKTGKPVEVINGDLTSIDKNEKFSVIILSHVIQHITVDMADELLADVGKRLEAGGILILTTTYIDGDEDKFFAEEWQDGERFAAEIDRNQFNEAFNKEGVLPVRMFSRKSIVGMAGCCGLELKEMAGYHYKNHSVAEEDRQANLKGDLSQARDCMYIFAGR